MSWSRPSSPPSPGRRRRLLVTAAGIALLLAPASASSLVPVLLAGIAVTMIGARVWAAASRRRERARVDVRDPGSGGTVLGRDAGGQQVSLTDEALGAHTLIVGASGSGKTTTLASVLGQRIETGAPVIAIDLKGSPSFARELESAAANAGRRVRVFSLDGATCWNPLAGGNATELKDRLIATERFTEPHYRRAAERYVQLALGVMADTEPPNGRSFARMVELLHPAKLRVAARSLPAPRRNAVEEYLRSLGRDQLSAIRGLQSRLAVVSESHIGPLLAPHPDGIEVRSALRGGDVVLFSLNSSRYGGLAGQLATMAVQDVVAATGDRLERGGGNPLAIVAIDEFSAVGSDNVLALLARGREAGVGVVLATQELTDLDRAARGLREQVLGNTAVKIAHRQDVPESARLVAQMAGTHREWEHSYQRRPGMFGGGPLTRESSRPVERFNIEPDVIATLPTGRAVVTIKVPRAETHLTAITAPARPAPATRPPGEDAVTAAVRRWPARVADVARDCGSEAAAPTPRPASRERLGLRRPSLRHLRTGRARGPER